MSTNSIVIGIGILLFGVHLGSNAQNNVGIGTLSPDSSAILELQSSNKGLLIPRSDTATINANFTPATGLMVYQTTDSSFYYYDGILWRPLGSTMQGVIGPTGAQGIQGATGLMGPSGAAGATGPTGTPGTQGLIGVTGPQGAQGGTGASGIQGPTGVDGALNAWSLTGNTGTIVGTNFLGTTDAEDLAIYTNNTERLRVLSSGNVGIGTTTPSARLVVSYTGDNTTRFVVGGGATEDVLQSFSQGASKAFIGLAGAPGNITVGTAAGDLAIRSNSQKMLFTTDAGATTAMMIDLAGNVGIGTTATMVSKLTVEGAASLGSTTILALGGAIGNSAAFSMGRATADIAFGVAGVAGHFSTFSTPGDVVIQNLTEDITLTADNATGAIRFGTGTPDTEKMTIVNNGNVGIGITNPQAGLAVSDRIRVEGTGSAPASGEGLEITYLTGTEPAGQLLSINRATSTYGDLHIGADTVHIGGGLLGSGNVQINGFLGIGTSITVPGVEKVTINAAQTPSTGSASNISIRQMRNGDSGIAWGQFFDTEIFRYEDSGSPLLSRTGITFSLGHAGVSAPERDVMTLLSSGNVGIGITNPPNRLEVTNGSVQVSGFGDTGFKIDITGGTTDRAWMLQNVGGTMDGRLRVQDLTAGREVMTFTTSGNVGIDMTTPTAKLQVNSDIKLGDGTTGGTITASTTVTDDGSVMIGGGGAANDNTRGGGISMFGNDVSFLSLNGTVLIDAGDDLNGKILLRTGSGAISTRMAILNSGNVGIGTATPGFQLELSTNSAAKPTGGTWAASSDRRLKKDITDLDSETALRKLTQLQGVSFNWIHPGEHGGQTGEIGFIAQDVQKIFPGWVIEAAPGSRDKQLIPEGEGIRSLYFPHAFNAYLIEALKEQQREIEELRLENKGLRSDMDKVKGILEIDAKSK